MPLFVSLSAGLDWLTNQSFDPDRAQGSQQSHEGKLFEGVPELRQTEVTTSDKLSHKETSYISSSLQERDEEYNTSFREDVNVTLSGPLDKNYITKFIKETRNSVTNEQKYGTVAEESETSEHDTNPSDEEKSESCKVRHEELQSEDRLHHVERKRRGKKRHHKSRDDYSADRHKKKKKHHRSERSPEKDRRKHRKKKTRLKHHKDSQLYER